MFSVCSPGTRLGFSSYERLLCLPVGQVTVLDVRRKVLSEETITVKTGGTHVGGMNSFKCGEDVSKLSSFFLPH
jgi:hypothetical protein